MTETPDYVRASVVSQPPMFGLGLCSDEVVLTPEQRRVLSRDLARLARQRRQDKATSHGIPLA